mmetsp:Transcript_6589/g.15520  ORF Transcript_6589/g.15520 Transcript_6589/m.15520 type:complete len:221 (-) Transcript_6589:558-1220(-)
MWKIDVRAMPSRTTRCSTLERAVLLWGPPPRSPPRFQRAPHTRHTRTRKLRSSVKRHFGPLWGRWPGRRRYHRWLRRLQRRQLAGPERQPPPPPPAPPARSRRRSPRRSRHRSDPRSRSPARSVQSGSHPRSRSARRSARGVLVASGARTRHRRSTRWQLAGSRLLSLCSMAPNNHLRMHWRPLPPPLRPRHPEYLPQTRTRFLCAHYETLALRAPRPQS